MTQTEKVIDLLKRWDWSANFHHDEHVRLRGEDYVEGMLDQLRECASELRAILDGDGEGDDWQPIETAPKSTAVGRHVSGVYLLGYCPDEAVDPKSCMSVIWWEPLTKGGVWYGQEAIEVRPTHYRPLPPPPGARR